MVEGHANKIFFIVKFKNINFSKPTNSYDLLKANKLEVTELPLSKAMQSVKQFRILYQEYLDKCKKEEDAK